MSNESEKSKKTTLTLRIETSDMKYLDEAVERVKEDMGIAVTRTWVVVELMKHGREGFESKFFK